jgi:hypothetical protein
LHDILPGKREWVLEMIEVPIMENGKVEAKMRGGKPLILIDKHEEFI